MGVFAAWRLGSRLRVEFTLGHELVEEIVGSIIDWMGGVIVGAFVCHTRRVTFSV